MDLEFRKKLTTYGISAEEYENMDSVEKAKIDKKLKAEIKGESITKVGEGIKAVGCLIILIPIMIGLIIFIVSLF